MIEEAKKLIHLNSYSIIAVDLSYKSPGIAIADIEESFHIRFIDNPFTDAPIGKGFDAMIVAAKRMQMLFEKIKTLKDNTKGTSILIIEVPYFSQNAKAAICAGLCMGLAHQLGALCISPDALKEWSGSKRGDKKDEVKKKVLSRLTLPGNVMNNDDIIDAVGIALLFDDKVSELRHSIIPTSVRDGKYTDQLLKQNNMKIPTIVQTPY